MTREEQEIGAAIKTMAAELKKQNKFKKLEIKIKLEEMYTNSIVNSNGYKDYLTELKNI